MLGEFEQCGRDLKAGFFMREAKRLEDVSVDDPEVDSAAEGCSASANQ